MKIQGRELRLEDSRYHYPLNHTSVQLHVVLIWPPYHLEKQDQTSLS